LTKERTTLERGGRTATLTGTKISCEAVNKAPKNLRNKEFSEIEAALGKPDVVDPAYKPPGGGVASAHQRLTWKFKDGSELIVDKPGPRAPGSKRPASADLPHAELHGPKGERLDPQGIVVPEASISAHMTITDQANRLEHYFPPARAKPK
jgi:hypothetical protein